MSVPLGMESSFVVRRAHEADVPAIAEMIEDFVPAEHPAHAHVRSIEKMRAAYFGASPVATLYVVTRLVVSREVATGEAAQEDVVGFVQWQPFFDLWWSKMGGRVEWLYIRPRARGFGLPAMLMARVASEVRSQGGEYLLGGGYSDDLASLYERVVRAWPSREAALSAEAFHAMADLNGKSPREIVRDLPPRALNQVQRPGT